ncbi:MAG: hypothetical protein UZ16_OP3001001477 [Candidatus Hinthialibacteria bacterium OLB16]|nr:MAG: hypothetical protein UZ16_OP3001001477 [Candidatus Hinthialibacteria bacterium OLB16]
MLQQIPVYIQADDYVQNTLGIGTGGLALLIDRCKPDRIQAKMEIIGHLHGFTRLFDGCDVLAIDSHFDFETDRTSPGHQPVWINQTAGGLAGAATNLRHQLNRRSAGHPCKEE